MWNRVYTQRNRRRVVGLPAAHAGERSLAWSTCASLDQQPAAGDPAGRNTFSGMHAFIKHLCLAGPATGARGLAGCNAWNAAPTWTSQTEAGRRARQATSKPCSISRLELPRAPDAFPLWPRWTRERGWPPFSKLFPNVGPACPPIKNDQALAIVPVHLFCFPLVFSFASSAKGQRSVPS